MNKNRVRISAHKRSRPVGIHYSADEGGITLRSAPWFSISWLFVFFLLYSLGVWLYTVFLRIQGDLAGFEQIEEYLMRPESLAGAAFFSWILVLPALALAARSICRPWWHGLGLVPFSLKSLAVWVLSLAFYLVLESMLLEFFQVAPGEFVTQMVGRREPFLILAIVLWAPLTEELLFRGYLFSAWRHTGVGLWGTLLFTSLLFALLHSQQYGLIPLVSVFCFSLLMGVAREKSGSVWLPVILHGFANLVSVIAVNFLGLV